MTEQRAKHTPGPWHVSKRSRTGTNLGVYDGQGNLVAAIDATSITFPRRWADANLIAAATETGAECDRLKTLNLELMAALRAMVEAYGSDDGGGPIAIIERSKTLIAKAGRS